MHCKPQHAARCKTFTASRVVLPLSQTHGPTGHAAVALQAGAGACRRAIMAVGCIRVSDRRVTGRVTGRGAARRAHLSARAPART